MYNECQCAWVELVRGAATTYSEAKSPQSSSFAEDLAAEGSPKGLSVAAVSPQPLRLAGIEVAGWPNGLAAAATGLRYSPPGGACNLPLVNAPAEEVRDTIEAAAFRAGATSSSGSSSLVFFLMLRRNVWPSFNVKSCFGTYLLSSAL